MLHVITTLNRGGAENHLVALINGQLVRGLQVEVAYLKGEGYWRSVLEHAGAKVTCLGLRYYGELRPALRLRQLWRTARPDLVHVHMPPAELYTRLAFLGNGKVAVVVSKHNDEPFFRGPGQRLVGRWVSAQAKHVIAISDAVNRYVTGPALGCPPSQTTTVHYGIDPTSFREVDPALVRNVRHEWSIRDDELLFGTIARLVPQKALHILIRGFALYVRRSNASSRLAIVGSGPLSADLRKHADENGISDKIIWAGFREDIPAVMGAFDVFALTSIYEGFGLVLLEAMAAGKPIVATRVSAIPEIVIHGKTGLLIDPRSPEQLASACLLFDERDRRVTFGIAGSHRVKSVFTLDAMVERTMAIYSQSLTDEVPPNG